MFCHVVIACPVQFVFGEESITVPAAFSYTAKPLDFASARLKPEGRGGSAVDDGADGDAAGAFAAGAFCTAGAAAVSTAGFEMSLLSIQFTTATIIPYDSSVEGVFCTSALPPAITHP